MSLSILIRLKNNEHFIGFTLQSILDFCPPDSEIIILNDNSDQNTIEKVQLFKELNYKIINCSNKLYSPGKFLNYGFRKCSNDVVLILSSHVEIISKIDLKTISNYLKKYVAVFGKQVPIYHGKKINPRYVWSHFKDKKIENMYSDSEQRYFLHNAFCFYNKNYLLNNPFREDLAGKEDRYWVNNEVSKGNSFLYDNELVCNHFYTSAGATWLGVS